jgi:hypothetical protein
MTAKERGPDAGNTGASEKNAPLKSKIDNSQASRRTQRKNGKRAENRARASTRRSYAVYDGQQMLGRIVLNEATNQSWAWNAARQFLGRFDSYKAASRAISRAAVTEWQRVEARQRLDDPHPPFATGLPEHFLRRD